MVIPKAPFPSFALALSRQTSFANEDQADLPPHERGPEVDLMKTFDPLARMPEPETSSAASDEDRSDTETVFEVREPAEERTKSGSGSGETSSRSSTSSTGERAKKAVYMNKNGRMGGEMQR
ncbi:hypothetical protein GALMADRAFT_207381 [Galerina marginata CBS 339.88]|uniref:Uncharacterized protein n=1 Tax=Galerina marginata (strain CBS 339.88) TaxID=685588 RepID=A0A067TFX8_GALM3|nr:hypothetical protein GALMADRAFT_207381 [Galerina marginata CBS 339.88]